MSDAYDTAPVTGKAYRLAGKPCIICGDPITWEFRVDGKPGHVDDSGYAIKDGRCPGPKRQPGHKPGTAYHGVARPPTPGNFKKLVAEARVMLIKANAKACEAIAIAEHIERATLSDDDSDERAAQWNRLNHAEKKAYLAGLLSQSGFPTEHPMTQTAIIARAEREAQSWMAGDTAIDVLLAWAQQIAGIDLGFEVNC